MPIHDSKNDTSDSDVVPFFENTKIEYCFKPKPQVLNARLLRTNTYKISDTQMYIHVHRMETSVQFVATNDGRIGLTTNNEGLKEFTLSSVHKCAQ